MRETGLLAPHRVGRTAAKPHGTITTDKVNEMWETDMTQTITIGKRLQVIRPQVCRELDRFELLLEPLDLNVPM